MTSKQAETTYVCTLDAKTAQKARDELHEVPEERLGAVEALRTWIQQQPHIHGRTDTATMLIFLRGAKFSQLRAREMLEKNLRLKIKAPEWFKDVDSTDPKLLHIIERGYSIPLPKRDKDGAQILLYKIGALDPSTKYVGVAEEIRTGIVTGTYIGLSELTQVNGTRFIFDFTGMTAKHMTRWKLEDMRKWFKVWQKNVPGRFKGFHYYNAGAFFEVMMNMAKPFMDKKFQDRLHTHPTLESLYQHIPMECLPEEYLPDDYKGPHQGSLPDIIRDYKKELTQESFRQYLLDNSGDKYYIDDSKKEDVPRASFRQLSVS